MDARKMISEIYMMSNGMVVVFDGKGEQMPELQGHYDSVKKKLFEKLVNQEFMPVVYSQNATERMVVSLYRKNRVVEKAYFGHD